jgi:hypothetical protein
MLTGVIVSIFIKCQNCGLLIYLEGHNRPYFGYQNGEVTFIDLNDPLLQEQNFTTVSSSVDGLAAAGSYIFVQDDNGYVFDKDGVLKTTASRNYYSSAYAWDSGLSRSITLGMAFHPMI